MVLPVIHPFMPAGELLPRDGPRIVARGNGVLGSNPIVSAMNDQLAAALVLEVPAAGIDRIGLC